MNITARTISTALVIASLAACGTSYPDETIQPGETKARLTGPTGTGFFGSDSLFYAMTDAVVASPAASSLLYLGTGSNNAERCLRGQAVTYNVTTFCNGSGDQSIAPMTRNFSGACQPGEVSHRIALSAISMWSAPG